MSKAAFATLIVAGSLLLAGCSQSTPQTTGPMETTTEDSMGTTGTAASPTMAAEEPAGKKMVALQEFTIETSNMKFTPNQIKVSQGQTVRITVKNVGGWHDFVLDEFNVDTKLLKGNDTEVVEFLADKKGSFEFYCSVPGHYQMGMKGTLVVE